MGRAACGWAGLSIALALTCAAAADVVELTTGERLQGVIRSSEGGVMHFDHPVLGLLKVPMDRVRMVSTEPLPPDLAQEMDAVEQQRIDKAQATAPAETAPAETAAAETPKLEQEKRRLIPGWDSKLDLGFNAAQGNSEFVNIYLGFKTLRTTETQRTTGDLSYFYNTNRGTRTKNQLSIGLLQDWLVPDSPWFYFAQARFDADEFAVYDHRLTAAAGPGYQLLKTENLNLRLRAGLGAAKEFASPNDDLRPEGLLGGELAWTINSRHQLAATTFFYPNLAELGRFRITSTADWTIRLNRGDGLNLKFGVKNEYESFTDDDTLHNDLRYYGSLQFNF